MFRLLGGRWRVCAGTCWVGLELWGGVTGVRLCFGSGRGGRGGNARGWVCFSVSVLGVQVVVVAMFRDQVRRPTEILHVGIRSRGYIGSRMHCA
jgi:hypothetical protein